MVHSFGLDFVPRRNWFLPLANSAFPRFLLAPDSWFSLLPPYSSLAWWPFLHPCCRSHLILTDSHVRVQPTPFSILIRVSLLSLLPKAPLGEQNCHMPLTYHQLLKFFQPRPKSRKGKSDYILNWLHIFPLVTPLSTNPRAKKEVNSPLIFLTSFLPYFWVESLC